MSAAATSRQPLGAPRTVPGRAVEAWQAAAGLVRLWRRRLRERSELARLNDRELYDFGASRGEALTEMKKPFWRE